MDDITAPMEGESPLDAMEEDSSGDEVDLAAQNDEGMGYIDRLAFEVENDGEEDGSFILGGDEDVALEIDSDEEPLVTIRGKGYNPQSMPKVDLSEEAAALLYWKIEGEETFSDWTIRVVDDGRNATKDYHVHRNVLAFGPKRSGYFEALFQSGHFRESANNTSEVSLPKDIAAHFPDFLDFQYCPPSECKRLIEKDNCYALHYLAQYFLVPELTKAIDGFISEDVYNLSHLEKYLSDFRGPENEVLAFLRPHATRACAELILSIELGSPLLGMLPPAMFLQIMTKARLNAKIIASDSQRHICELAIDYVRSQQSNIDDYYFYALTSELHFPNELRHAGPVAIDLLKMLKQNRWDMRRNYSGRMEWSGFKQDCTALLSRFLAHEDRQMTQGMWMSLAADMPHDVVSSLLASSFGAKIALAKEESIKTVTCKIMSLGFGVPVGHTVHIPLKPSDTVGYIRYLVGRRLDETTETLRVFRGKSKTKLDWDALVCNCDIASGTVLEIR
ncbi:hypothetical protein ACHAXT_010853 [Thalassiosira profunda]